MAEIFSIDSLHTLVNSQFEERDLAKECKAIPTLSRTTLEVFRRALERLAAENVEIQQKFRDLPNLQTSLNSLKETKARCPSHPLEQVGFPVKKLRDIAVVGAGVTSLVCLTGTVIRFTHWSAGAFVALPTLILAGALQTKVDELEKVEKQQLELNRARQQARNSATAFEAFFTDKRIQNCLQRAITTKLRSSLPDSIRAKIYLLAQEELKKSIDYCEVY